MLKVYNYMATGVLLTGIIALLSFKMSVVTDASGAISGFTSLGNALFFSGLKWIVMLAPLGIVFYMSFGINKMSAAKAQTVFWIFAALMGLSLSWILLVYTGVSVARVFFITSATFGAMSIYGYTTKRDLTKLGSFLMIRRPPRSTPLYSSAASDVYKRQLICLKFIITWQQEFC